jgi:hypothetical protein
VAEINDNGEVAERPTGELRLFLSDDSVKDFFLAVTWQGPCAFVMKRINPEDRRFESALSSR